MGLQITKDDKVWRRLQKQLEQLSHLATNVGIVNSRSFYPEGISVAQNAQWQNEGTRNIPKRPFISRIVSRAQAGTLSYVFKQAVIGVGTSTTTARNAIDKVGEHLAGLIKEEIMKGDFTELAKSTIRQKGHEHPLLETGKLIDHVGHEVTNA